MPDRISIRPRPGHDGGGRPELVVIAKQQAGLRALADGVASVADGVDTSSLGSVLESHGAVMRPLFGLSEDRLRAQVAELAGPAAAGADADAAAPPDLSSFYRVVADEDRFHEIAEALLAYDLIEAAYVKPGGEPAPRRRARAPADSGRRAPGHHPTSSDARGTWRPPPAASTRRSGGRCREAAAPASTWSTASGPGASRTRTCCRIRAASSPGRPGPTRTTERR